MEKINDKTDEELLLLSLEESESFAILIERYEGKLSRYIARLCNCTREDIEDLLQEIFIKIYRNINGFDQELKFSSWAYRIAHNEVISHYRKIKARPQNIELIPDLPYANAIKGDDFTKIIDNKLNKGKIAEIFGKMDLKYKEILVLRFYEQKDYNELSDILKKPSGTVATLLNRAKKQFKQIAIQSRIEF